MEGLQKELLRLDKATRYGRLISEVDSLLAALGSMKQDVAAGKFDCLDGFGVAFALFFFLR
jgi:hypothetical protein